MINNFYFSLFNRLSFAADPAEILRCCPSSLVFLCLQYCPQQNVLYACAGMRAPAEADAAGGRKQSVSVPKGAAASASAAGAPGASAAAGETGAVRDNFWVIDKVIITVEQIQ